MAAEAAHTDMNPQTYVGALRTYLATSLSLTSLPELGNAEDFADVTATTLYAYTVGEVEAEHHTPAVLDSSYRIPVNLYCAVKEGTSTEAASVVRNNLSAAAGYATAWSSWTSPPAGLLMVTQEGGPYVGSGDEWEAWLASRGQNWTAGHVTVVLHVIVGWKS